KARCTEGQQRGTPLAWQESRRQGQRHDLDHLQRGEQPMLARRIVDDPPNLPTDQRSFNVAKYCRLHRPPFYVFGLWSILTTGQERRKLAKCTGICNHWETIMNNV